MKVEPTPVQRAHLGIMHQANECEQALRLAAFAEVEAMPDVAAGLRKLAAFHSDHAFQWAGTLVRSGGVA